MSAVPAREASRSRRFLRLPSAAYKKDRQPPADFRFAKVGGESVLAEPYRPPRILSTAILAADSTPRPDSGLGPALERETGLEPATLSLEG